MEIKELMDCWLCRRFPGSAPNGFTFRGVIGRILYFGPGRRYSRSPMRAAAATQRPVASSTTSAAGLPPAPPSVKRNNLALVLDVSGSMGWDRTVMPALKHLCRNLIGQFDLNHARITVVTFQSVARVTAQLGSSEASLTAAVEALSAGGGTRIDLGLQTAFTELQSARSLTQGQDVVFVVSDGVNNGGDRGPITVANTLKAAGVVVFAVGLGGARVLSAQFNGKCAYRSAFVHGPQRPGHREQIL